MTKERKTNRKSPKPRVDQAELGRPNFSPCDSDWVELEKRLEKPLDDLHRKFVVDTINEYNEWYFAERTGAFVCDTREVVIRVKRLIDDLNCIITGNDLLKFDSDSLYEARSLILTHFNGIAINSRIKLDHTNVVEIFSDLSITCAMADRDLSNMDGLIEGEMWSEMVNQLRNYLKRAGFRTGVSNSSLNKQPFVDFMMYLSKIEFGPTEHVTSNGSLAKAILLSAQRKKE